MTRLLWLIPVLAVAAAGPNLTGTWTGSIDVADPSAGTTVNTPVRAEFQQKDNVVSGRIGRQQDERSEPIRNGRVEGDKLMFEVTAPETEGAIRFELTITGEFLEGSMQGKLDSGPITGKVRLTRKP